MLDGYDQARTSAAVPKIDQAKAKTADSRKKAKEWAQRLPIGKCGSELDDRSSDGDGAESDDAEFSRTTGLTSAPTPTGARPRPAARQPNNHASSGSGIPLSPLERAPPMPQMRPVTSRLPPEGRLAQPSLDAGPPGPSPDPSASSTSTPSRTSFLQRALGGENKNKRSTTSIATSTLNIQHRNMGVPSAKMSVTPGPNGRRSFLRREIDTADALLSSSRDAGKHSPPDTSADPVADDDASPPDQGPRQSRAVWRALNW